MLDRLQRLLPHSRRIQSFTGRSVHMVRNSQTKILQKHKAKFQKRKILNKFKLGLLPTNVSRRANLQKLGIRAKENIPFQHQRANRTIRKKFQ